MSLYDVLTRKDRGFTIVMLLMAVITLMTTAGVMMVTWDHQQGRWHSWLAFLPATSVQGERVFRDKGCAYCHSIDSVGGKLAPELSQSSPAEAALPQLVTAMWNHAPRMWEHMQAEKLPYPELSYEEAAQLLGYLYGASQREPGGDPEIGRALFHTKQCSRCHAVQGVGGKLASDLSSVRYADRLAWSGAMLSHAAEMERTMAKIAVRWPEFSAGELNDVLTYLQKSSVGSAQITLVSTGDPDQGWQVFQSKSCLACHSVKQSDTGPGPSLGESLKIPASPLAVAAAMWNKFPGMRQGIHDRRLSRFEFRDREMADLMAFVQTLRYFEPTGSPHVGRTIFASRGCARCHGAYGEGTNAAPPIRHKSRIYNSVSLAVALWAHGARMHEQALRMGLGWPTLQQSDVGDLVAFLNQPVRRIASE